MESNLIKANDVLIPEDVVNGFEIDGTLTEIKRLGNGHINRTYFVYSSVSGSSLSGLLLSARSASFTAAAI